MGRRVWLNGMRVTGALVATLVFGGAIYCGLIWTRSKSVTDRPGAEDDQVVAAITQLRSANSTEREAAKEALLKQGSDAVLALIAALEELSRDPKPQFDLGNEAAGAEALRRYESVPRKEKNPSEYLSIDITWRVKKDMIELLGRLRDKAAVPILIELTRQELHTSQNEYLHSPMQALTEIGEPAVPQILEAIEKVRSKAATDVSGCCPNTTDAKRRAIIESQSEIMIARLSIVLGEIRDVQALPALEELIATRKGRRSYAAYYIRRAISKITARAKEK